jgi:dTDP-4-dehydrorhamnose 3,5-epimerase
VTPVVEVREFGARRGAIDDLWVVDVKQVTDDRGTINEVFRRSAFEEVGIALAPFRQVNVTSSHVGVLRGLHAEAMTKLVTVASGFALGAYVDLRPGAATFGRTETHELRPGRQILVPAGVANGFQALTDECVYVYCFDAEWQPGMAGRAVTPLDPDLRIAWPIAIDPADPALISAKDAAAPTLGELRRELEGAS